MSAKIKTILITLLKSVEKVYKTCRKHENRFLKLFLAFMNQTFIRIRKPTIQKTYRKVSETI